MADAAEGNTAGGEGCRLNQQVLMDVAGKFTRRGVDGWMHNRLLYCFMYYFKNNSTIALFM